MPATAVPLSILWRIKMTGLLRDEVQMENHRHSLKKMI
jgi:hypothetical protein